MVKKLLYTCLMMGSILTLAIVISQPAVQGQEPTSPSERIPLSINNMDQIQLLGASLVETSRNSGGLPDFSASSDRLVAVPNSGSLLDMTTLETWRFAEGVRQFVLSPDEQNVLVLQSTSQYGRDTTYRLWRLGQTPAAMTEIAILGATDHYQITENSYRFSDDNSKIAIPHITRDAPIYVWDVQTGTRFPPIEDYAARNSSYPQRLMMFNHDGSVLAIFGDQTIRLWDVETGQRFAIMEALITNTETLFAFSPDGSSFAYKGSDNQLHIYSLATRTEQLSLPFPDRGNYEFFYSSDGSTIVFYGNGIQGQKSLTLWDSVTGDLILEDRVDDEENAVFRRNGDFMAVWYVNHARIDIWDVQQHEQVKSLHVAADVVYEDRTQFALSRSNQVVAIRNVQEIWLFDRRNNRPRTISLQSSNEGRTLYYESSIDFTLDDSVLITSDIPNTAIQFWDVRTGQQLTAVSGYEFVLSPDGTTIEVSTSWGAAEAVMFYGIPSDGRAVHPAIPGRVLHQGINLRNVPVINAPRTDIIEGMIVAAGRSSDNTHIYLSSHNGWVRAGAPYTELVFNLPIDMLPVFDSTPSWGIAAVQTAPTFMPTPDTLNPTRFPTATPSSPTVPPTTTPSTPVTPVEVAALPPIESQTRPAPPADLEPITPENADDVRLLAVIRGDNVALTDDGAYILIQRETTLELWDATTLSLVTSLEGINMIRVVGGGKLVIYTQPSTSSRNQADLFAWNLADSTNSDPFLLGTVSPQTVMSDENGDYLIFSATTDGSQQTQVWDMNTLRKIGAYDRFRSFVRFSPDQSRLILGNSRTNYGASQFINITEIDLINLENGDVQANLVGTSNAFSDVYFSTDSSRVAVGGNNVRVWDTATGEQRAEISTRAEIVFITPDRAVTFSPQTTLLRIWDISGDDPLELGQLRDSILNFAVNPSETAIATLHSDQTVHVWEIETGHEIATFTATVDQIALSADSHYLAGVSGQQLLLFDLENNTELPSLGPLPADILSLEFSPEGDFLQITLADHTLRHIDLNNPSVLLPITYNFAGKALDFTVEPFGYWVGDGSATGQFIYIPTSFEDTDIHFVAGGRRVNFSTLPATIAISPDGTTVVASTVTQGYRRPASIMIFGIPTADRPAWQPIEAQLAAESIHLRAEPHSNAEILGYVFNDGPIYIGGQYDNHFYLPDLGGWVRAEPIYIELDDEHRAQIPSLNDPSQ